MVKFVRNFLILLFVCAAPAAQTFAQLHPMPGSKSEAPVLCTGCKGNNYFGQANAFQLNAELEFSRNKER